MGFVVWLDSIVFFFSIGEAYDIEGWCPVDFWRLLAGPLWDTRIAHSAQDCHRKLYKCSHLQNLLSGHNTLPRVLPELVLEHKTISSWSRISMCVCTLRLYLLTGLIEGFIRKMWTTRFVASSSTWNDITQRMTGWHGGGGWGADLWRLFCEPLCRTQIPSHVTQLLQ